MVAFKKLNIVLLHCLNVVCFKYYILVKQYAEICMFTNAHYKCTVAELETEYAYLFVQIFVLVFYISIFFNK